ncbi:MAG: ATP-grasp domain-containing protein [Gammaproteobacteria bacterium]|nr:ATP-grasp domain-containing protein [Gammaproteobacteria bacterium]
MTDVSIEPIRRLLIANRGEIARRIIRTAHEMGIATVAVYADGDVGAPFVVEADAAIALNGKTSAETYLDIGKILEACRRSGADAVHPGYGFLSENATFAKAVVEAGLRWVGPSPAAIGQMGDKLAAKRLIQEAEVPTLPAIELTPDADLEAAADEIGYPVLVKAAAGGGGRGMRIVETADQLPAAVEGARREAGAAFGDDTLFLERWLVASRHVEIQILGDKYGNLVHLFERECSIQRRHQKIIEEAPSPAVDEELRRAMGGAAVSAAQRIGYSSAGTVEFLLAGREFFFLEVNTRLQVEHPVTEAITGLDLVREQLRIAQGEALGYGQDDLSFSGHAIEARIYAEDPVRNFLPSPGTVDVWRPAADGLARFDSGVESGSEVSVEFDPMIAKVIAHAPTRREAAARLARALERTSLQGLRHNRDFLVATLREPAFLAGDTTTDFIERIDPARARDLSAEDLADAVTAAVMCAQAIRRASAKVLHGFPSGWRNSVMPPERTTFKVGDGRAAHEVAVSYRSRRDGTFAMTIGEAERTVAAYSAGEGGADLEIDGRRVQFAVAGSGDRWFVHGADYDVELVELPRLPLPEQYEIKGGLTAPMPGNVLATHIAEGDAVAEGQLLLVLEAMKMQHRITAPFDGTVKEVHVAEGQQVDNGALLVLLEESEPSGEEPR